MHAGDLIGGRYRLAEKLGEGAFGVVWRADEVFQGEVISPVAVKVFTSPVDVRELQILATCDHPKVLRYRGIVEHEEVGREYICLVTELAEGGDVAEMLRAFPGGLPPVQVERIVLSIAEALSYLHGRDPPIVHRDIKPQNMLVVGDTFKLGDVGTARALEGGSRDTSRGLGSLAYTAPERFDRRVGPESDVYSLAISAYELLTGGWAYSSEEVSRLSDVQLMRHHLDSAPAIPGDLPDHWQELLRCCLTKDPSERWNAIQVVRFLRGRTAGAEVLGHPAPAPRPLPKTVPVSDLAPQPSPQPPSPSPPLAPRERGDRGVRSRWSLVAAIGAILAAAVGFGAWQLSGDDEEHAEAPNDEHAGLIGQGSGDGGDTKAPPDCGPTEHLSGGHCCPGGEEWVEARGRCLCLDKSLCGSGNPPTFEVKAPGDWVVIRAGTFVMGSPESEPGRQGDETQHRVTLTRDFMMQATEVTQGQWQDVMGNNPSHFKSCGRSCPVDQVRWYDALAYCNALSRLDGLDECYDLSACTGRPGDDYDCPTSKIGWSRVLDCRGYRLPTEAEWEYAARAGTTAATYNGDLDSRHLKCQRGNDVFNPIGWFCGNSEVSYSGSYNCTDWGGFRRCGPQPVKQKRPNAWGLYDMLGNVWEWNWDRYAEYPTGPTTDPVQRRAGSGRVVRGGSWGSDARGARAANRFRVRPAGRDGGVGFRPVRSLP